MKLKLFAAVFAMTVIPVSAGADSHTCGQLRLSVENRVPTISRDLPYAAMDCAGISELHLLLVRFNGTTFNLNQRIEAVFRRYGLVN
jgi:hypothetical protein